MDPPLTLTVPLMGTIRTFTFVFLGGITGATPLSGSRATSLKKSVILGRL